MLTYALKEAVCKSGMLPLGVEAVKEDAENIKALLRLYQGPIKALLRPSLPAGVAAVAEDDAVHCLCSGAVSIRQHGGGGFKLRGRRCALDLGIFPPAFFECFLPDHLHN